MRQTKSITIEHVIVASELPYEQVVERLQSRLGPPQAWRAIGQQAGDTHASWEQFARTAEAHIGASGLTPFFQVEHSFLLSLVGKTSRATQYTIGNPVFATQMTQYVPEAGLYAPLKMVVYEDEVGRTFVAYDGFVSLLAQYQREEITQVAREVEQKLEALIAAVTTAGEV